MMVDLTWPLEAATDMIKGTARMGVTVTEQSVGGIFKRCR